jgi:hyperosmotically inducible periplasmic protein
VNPLKINAKSLLLSGSMILASMLAISPSAMAQDQTTPAPATAPDNTAKNKHHTTTADQQTNAAGDRDLTAQIRKSIIADKSLSTYAHNVKIITVNGMVTLKGPVKSDEEKKTIAELAVNVAGADKVKNNITVKQ